MVLKPDEFYVLRKKPIRELISEDFIDLVDIVEHLMRKNSSKRCKHLGMFLKNIFFKNINI